ncbi:MAG TPA: aminopeptidase N [Nocardioides bacterium]|uniref:aminopeptidase N n=1 Tax=uncultured Nocardioides sp. TaxID=198441 RepID=UPI000EC3D2CA|nr:aminopeptidase N [uncultured Nocardioides sp.]HCB07864.1 aminopeptidase N [Nocardioides sp.]
MPSPYASLQRTEALARRELLDLSSYDVALDLASDQGTFDSVTTIRFRSRAGATFLDLKPLRVGTVRLDGRPLDLDLLERGRFPLELTAGDHELVVEATMPFRNDGEGLHRSVDPADGRHYVYGMSFMDAAPTIFACFDQPDLKAPYTLHVRAPEDWVVIGNAPGRQVERGVWEFDQSQPLSTYFVTLVAGPYHVIRDEHDGIPLGLSARASIAADLDKDADELFTLTKQSFDELHRLFGIRYPFGDYHQAFVPEFNAGAMENPGCVTFRDPLVFTSRVTRGIRISRASTLAHEMAHQWFGNLVTPAWWDDLWLNESFAEYMGNRVTADVTQYADIWVDDSYARRQWGLVADQRPSTHPVAGNGAVDASAALQDFDGISYAKGCAILKQINASLGDDVFFEGVVDHFESHRFGNATMHDLFASWERAGAGDLGDFTDNWLRTAGPDRIVLDRATGVVRRTPPAAHPADRPHRIRAAVAGPDGTWTDHVLEIDAPETPFDAGDRPVLLDPYDDTWALLIPDKLTMDALESLLPAVADPQLRAGAWSNIRSALHNAAVDPVDVLEVAVRSLPVEDTEDTRRRTMAWLLGWVVPLQPDPAAALAQLHEAAQARLDSAAPTSEEQLAAFRAAIATCASTAVLQAWLRREELPEGIGLDLDLRWRILVRLATLGAVDLAELDRQLAAEPTAVARVGHAGARASLPDPEAKAWAWSCFTGEVDLPNYELEAVGLGFWRGGQAELTAPYVERYFADLPDTVHRRSGWVLADAAEHFFPRTSLTRETLARAEALIADGDLDLSIRRRLVDAADDLGRKLSALEAFPHR